VSAAARCLVRHVPGGRVVGRGRRDVMLRALQRPQIHIAGAGGPRRGRGRRGHAGWARLL